jgi:hypothetical protein
VKRVCFGAGDYANDLGLTPTLEERELEDARATDPTVPPPVQATY